MMEEYRYKAVARAAYGDIVEGATVTISSERVVEQSTGQMFQPVFFRKKESVLIS